MTEIKGQVRAENGLPASGLAFELFRERFGADPELVSALDTDADGNFAGPDVDLTGPVTLVAKVRRQGQDDVVLTPLGGTHDPGDLRLVVPAGEATFATEFQRLNDAVTPILGGASLATAQETATRRDLSLLHRESGWDARLVAMASLSARLSQPMGQQPATGLDEQALYGLLRAGLPSDRSKLARVAPETVRAALDKSVDSGVIAMSKADRGRVVESFQAFAAQEQLASRPAGGVSSVSELLDASGLSSQVQDSPQGQDSPRSRFEKVVLEHTPGESLWDKAAAAGIEADTISELRSQAKLAFLTTNNAPLMARVQSDVAQAATLGQALVAGSWDKPSTWQAAVTDLGGADAVPPGFQQDDDPVGAYASELARRVRVSFPTHVVAAMVGRGDLPLGADAPAEEVLATTLERAGELGFRLGATHAQSFLDENSAVLDGVAAADQLQVTAGIATLQRTYQLSPSNESMKVLLDHGLTSAYDIVNLSESAFIDRYAAYFPSEIEARLVHRKAEQVSAVLYNFYSMTRQATSAPELVAVSGTTEQRQVSVDKMKAVLPTSPTMESLFGSMDFCECDHCRSVLGPAAYLVDLLKFLDPDPLAWKGFKDDWAQRHNGEEYAFGTPYDELVARRPDLPDLQLSCENTNVELPVIDLVNEILEVIVAQAKLTADAVHDSGAVDSADVMTEPEFVLDAAYERLRTSTFPSLLPFDVWQETVREFAGWLEAPLASLHELFRPDDDPLGARFAAALERLGLTRAEADVLTTAKPLDGWWTRFGFAPAASEEQEAAETLRRAKQLARRLGVGYQDLADLLETHFVNPSLDDLGVLTTAGVSVADALVWRKDKGLVGTPPPTDGTLDRWQSVQSVQERLDVVTRTYGLEGTRAADTWLSGLPDAAFKDVIVLVDPDVTCDFDRTLLASAATSTPLTAARLGAVAVKLDLFVRLRRAVGWATADLDQALRAFVPGGTDGTGLFGDPLRTALVYLAHLAELEEDLGTDPEDRRRLVSLWADLTTAGPSPLYAELFLRRPVGQRDASFVAPLGDTLSTDAVGAGDLRLSRSHAPTLQGALGMRLEDLQAIADRDPAHPWSDLELSLASVSEQHRYAYLSATLGWTVPALLTLQRLSGLDPFHTVATQPLTGADDDHPLQHTLTFVRQARQLDRTGISTTELDYLLAHRVDPNDEQSPDPAATELLLDTLGTKLAEALRRAAAAPTETDVAPPATSLVAAPTPEQIAAALVAAAVGPRGGLVAALLSGDLALKDPSAPPADAPDLVSVFLGMNEDGAEPDAVVRAHLLLSKVLLLADKLDLDARECQALGLGELPLAPVEGAAPAYANLIELLTYVALRKQIQAAPDQLLDVLVAASTPRSGAGSSAASRLSAAAAVLAAATRRTPEGVSSTLAAAGITADILSRPSGIDRAWQALALVERLGVDADVVKGWLRIADPGTSSTDRRDIARSVKDAVRSNLGPARWRQMAKPVSDRLRQRQRDALVATVLHDQGLSSIEELYQLLLLDPGSEPVLRTSRIRQAISAVQLFVQRCLLNIEPRVHASALNAEHWEWMKRYRVWEANRKIFLYPENWLEPEFRDDKTHLFDELESTLLQNDVSADVVEDAFLVYLRSLEEIARLDVVAFYTEQDALDPGSTTLHVIGRTHGGPHQYHYRRFQHGMWTPWEPMGLDIEGDHVVPVVWRDRLHVFWVTFLQKSDDADSNPQSDSMFLKPVDVKLGILAGGAGNINVSAPVTGKPPPKLADTTLDQVQQGARKGGVSRRVDVQLHWSEYVRGKWSTSSSGGFGRVPEHVTNSAFDPASVFVHASTLFEEGEEAGVQVHLTGGMTRTFLLRSRNSVPETGLTDSPAGVPYNTPRASINRYAGSGSLTVTFAQTLTSVDGGAATATSSTLGVLGRAGGYNVLPSANALSIGGGDIAQLVSPFFFQDARRTFFVEPSLLETTVESWEEWIVPDPDPGTSFTPGDIEARVVSPFIPPELHVLVTPDDTDPLPDPWNDLFTTIPRDLITSPDVAVLFDDAVLGARGSLGLTFVSPSLGVDVGAGRPGAGDLIGQGTIGVVTGGFGEGLVNAVQGAGTEVGAGTELVAHQVVLVDHTSLLEAGLSTSTDRIKIIGGSGFATALLDSSLNQGLTQRLAQGIGR